jgi:hypothetical protein
MMNPRHAFLEKARKSTSSRDFPPTLRCFYQAVQAAVTAATPKGYHLSMTVYGYDVSGSDERPGQSTPKPHSIAPAALRYSGDHASHITETKASASKEQDHRRGKLLPGIGWPGSKS